MYYFVFAQFPICNAQNYTYYIESRRIITTERPFSNEQMREYLKFGLKLTEVDVEKMIDVIDNEFTYSLGHVERLVTQSLNTDGTIDYHKVAKHIEEEKEYCVKTIGAMCGNKETAQKLRQFVIDNGKNQFGIGEWSWTFGRLWDANTISNKLLQNNWLFYTVETACLEFHSAIVRNAILELI